MIKLTERQKYVVSVIDEYIKDHGYSPTMRELSSILKIQLKGTYDHLIALKKKGQVTWENEKSRTIRLLKDK